MCAEYLPDGKLNAVDQQAKRECNSLFEENTAFGDKDISEAFRLKFSETLQNHQLIYKKMNKAKAVRRMFCFLSKAVNLSLFHTIYYIA